MGLTMEGGMTRGEVGAVAMGCDSSEEEPVILPRKNVRTKAAMAHAASPRSLVQMRKGIVLG